MTDALTTLVQRARRTGEVLRVEVRGNEARLSFHRGRGRRVVVVADYDERTALTELLDCLAIRLEKTR